MKIEGSRILVTGATGFIGSYFVKYLLSNYKDIVVVGMNRHSNMKNKQRLNKHWDDERFIMHYLDFTSDPLDDAFKDIDIVVHSGAKTFVDFSIKDARPFIDSNIVGTWRMLEAARRCDTLQAFLQISTDEVYGAILEGAYKEDARLNPTNSYAATKAGADLTVLAYYNTYKFPAFISRMENVYGPYQGREKVFPVFTRKALNGEVLPLYGDGQHIRQWCHVEDAIMGFITILEKGTQGEIYHIAGNQELKNIELAKIILKTLDKDEKLLKFISDEEMRPGHDRRYALNSDKIRALGWEPKWTLNTGIPDVVKWYRDNLDWHK